MVELPARTILAHDFSFPTGLCPCGHIIMVPKGAGSHTCHGCGRTYPVRHYYTVTEWEAIQNLAKVVRR